jgi:hypothetical protein
MQVALDLSDTLRSDFPGFEALRQDANINYTGKTRAYDTIVADAARYYGVVPLVEPATTGDYGVRAGGIFTQLVPSTRVEVPIADARLNQQLAALVEAGQPFTRTLTLAFSTAQALYVGGSILPGTLTVTRGGVTIRDRGGSLVDAGGSVIGDVNYESGVLTLSSNVWGTSSGSHTVTYQPAMRPTFVTGSAAEIVTQQNQRLSYAFTFNFVPARGTLQVSYRAQGRWYTLSDNGAGELRGTDTSYGAGMLNYDTGTVALTLGALPDVESSVIFSFVGSPLSVPVPPAAVGRFGKTLSLGDAVLPGSINITWAGGAASDANGRLTGSASGAIEYTGGRIEFSPNTLPAQGASLSVTWTHAVPGSGTVFPVADGGAVWTFHIITDVKPYSVSLTVAAHYAYTSANSSTPQERDVRVTVFDDGAGALRMGNIQVGTIDYGTGACALDKAFSGYAVSEFVQYPAPIWDDAIFTFVKGEWVTAQAGGLLVQGASIPGGSQNVQWSATNNAPGAAGSASFTLDQIFLAIGADMTSPITGAQLRLVKFTLGDDLYVREEEDWLRNPDATTGAGTPAGTDAVIDNVPGVLLTSWTAGTSSTPTNVAGATAPDITGPDSPLAVTAVTFRTAVSPLLNGAFQIAGNWRSSGAAFTAQADANGIFATGGAPVDADSFGTLGAFGVIDYEMGVCNVAFGQRAGDNKHAGTGVVDISALGVPGVSFIKWAQVQADTLRYNAVGYSYMPLDAEILGLDPVRLPADGRVPIFRPGTVCVVGHTKESTPLTAVNGHVYDCGRVRLSRVRVIGADGVVITSGWAVDLEAGLVNFTNTAGWAQPVVVQHRIEDMVLCSDAQLSGHLTFTRPVSHNYPADESYVSSALIAGDMGARVSHLFDQATWNNVWQDSVAGNPAGGTYNDIANPITVTNAGAVTERWAIVFTNVNTFNVIGEHVGQILSGNTSTDCAPPNPAAPEGAPYFHLAAAGWGGGWSTGNVLRINTVGAGFPVWVARTILQGPETVPDDSFTILIRGDVDNENL